jgi:UDPglucose 6-dehydrogenase
MAKARHISPYVAESADESVQPLNIRRKGTKEYRSHGVVSYLAVSCASQTEEMKQLKTCILGTGYVGLATGACSAYLKHQVTCLDVNEEKIGLLRKGIVPFHEPGLPELLNLGSNRIDFTDFSEGLSGADVVFIAVGAPRLPDGNPDLYYVRSEAEQIGDHVPEHFTVVVNKSIGSSDPKALEILHALYRLILDRSFPAPDFAPRPEGLGAVPMVTTSPTSAELIKYAANTFRSVKISFANDIGHLAEGVGADISEVARGIGDYRIGNSFLQAGLGWGGSCFGKDTAALVATAREYGVYMRIVQSARDVNHGRRERVVEKLPRALKILKGRQSAFLAWRSSETLTTFETLRPSTSQRGCRKGERKCAHMTQSRLARPAVSTPTRASSSVTRWNASAKTRMH